MSVTDSAVSICAKLIIYCQIRRTRMTIPPTRGPDHHVDLLDLGQFAHVGMMAVDEQGLPVNDSSRQLTVTQVAGDHTATVHVEPYMWLNIEFNSSAAVLSFHVTLYEVYYIDAHFSFKLEEVCIMSWR